MNYSLKSGRHLSGNIRRIARRQIGRAIKLLSGNRSSPDRDSTHEARKWLKKTRATVRLIRPVAGRAVCRRENRRFREIARRLSRQRDAEVLLGTLEKLRRQPHDPAVEAALARLDSVFESRREAAAEQLRAKMGHCRAQLRKARRRVKAWPLRRLDRWELSRALRRSYRRGLEALAAAARTGAPEHFHEWRKRAKDLWYQSRLLQPAEPKALASLADDLKVLSEQLGDEHDLVMLEAALQTARLERAELNLVLALTRSKRSELQRAALTQGRRLYAEEPREFGRRVKKYLKH